MRRFCDDGTALKITLKYWVYKIREKGRLAPPPPVATVEHAFHYR